MEILIINTHQLLISKIKLFFEHQIIRDDVKTVNDRNRDSVYIYIPKNVLNNRRSFSLSSVCLVCDRRVYQFVVAILFFSLLIFVSLCLASKRKPTKKKKRSNHESMRYITRGICVYVFNANVYTYSHSIAELREKYLFVFAILLCHLNFSRSSRARFTTKKNLQ